MENTVIISGSARKNGDTQKMIDSLRDISGWDVIYLMDYTIAHYDYNHENRTDDYVSLIQHLSSNYTTYIFATPVYWYAMSGMMKVFFDRLTDLLTIEKDLGRSLRGKAMAVVSCSNGSNLGDKFWLPFSESAVYLGMHYLGNLHTLAGNTDHGELKKFTEDINRLKPQ